MDSPRTATLDRKTNETDIKVSINLDDKFDQKIHIDTGIGFLDHVGLTAVNILIDPKSLTPLSYIKYIDVPRPCQARRMVIKFDL